MGNGRSEQGPSGMDTVRWNSGCCVECAPPPDRIIGLTPSLVAPHHFRLPVIHRFRAPATIHTLSFHLVAATSVGRYPERP